MMIQSGLKVPAAMVAAEAESLSLFRLFHGEKDKLNVCFHGWLATLKHFRKKLYVISNRPVRHCH
jgi:hypothetical protein